MKKNSSPSTEELIDYRDRFLAAIDLIYNCFRESAFHNISPRDTTRLVSKSSPTIYDSIIIASDYVLRKGRTIGPTSSEEQRRSLLLDPGYKQAIGKETMTRESINTRISKACLALYSETYE